MGKSVCVFVLGLALNGACLGATAFAAAGVPPGASAKCTKYVQGLPAEIETDFIMVPEDWDNPTASPLIPIFFYAPDLYQNQKWIAYFNGGPGGSTHGIYAYFKKYTPLSAGVPFLYIDQRGTGCSGSFPEVPVTLEGAKRMALYGTRSIVRDAEAVRRHLLKDKPWGIFGQSYGGYIVHRYIALYPKSVEHAVVQGASLMDNGIRWVETRLLAQQRAATEYLKQYPGDAEILEKARSQVPADYCQGNQTAVACGPGLLDGIAWGQIAFPKGWPNLHKTYAGLLKADGTLDLAYLGTLIPKQVDATDSMADFLVAVVPGRELPGGLLNTWSCQKAVPRMKRKGIDTNSWFYSECRGALSIQAKYDSFLKKIVKDDSIRLKDVHRSLKKNPGLQFHLFSGELDTFVARESYQQEVKKLGRLANFSFMNVMNIGHDWTNSKEVWAALKKY
ncbi:MAG: alpha/beta hydrolase [Bdellovibrionales bacterium]|nr:alpha/beta hydrolase [Bdellovibrionales bacterium]